MEYLKDKIKELEQTLRTTTYKKIICRKVNEFKRGYQPRNNLVKDENGDLWQIPIII
jgi:hypothetical protein